MPRLSFPVLTIAAALLLAAVLPVSASSRHPFRGSWKGTDGYDQSTIFLKIVEESRSHGVIFEISARDDRTGNWCSTNGKAEMSAIGVLQDDYSMAVMYLWRCLPPGDGLFPEAGSGPALEPDTYTYYPDSDTITDTWGTIYYRDR